jgi:hypothetical protein
LALSARPPPPANSSPSGSSQVARTAASGVARGSWHGHRNAVPAAATAALPSSAPARVPAPSEESCNAVREMLQPVCGNRRNGPFVGRALGTPDAYRPEVLRVRACTSHGAHSRRPRHVYARHHRGRVDRSHGTAELGRPLPQPSSSRPCARGGLGCCLSPRTRDFDTETEFWDAALGGTGHFRSVASARSQKNGTCEMAPTRWGALPRAQQRHA